MKDSQPSWSDERMEQRISTLLRIGVLLAAGVVLLGGIIYLAQHGPASPRYGVFRGEPIDLRGVSGILRDLLELHPLGLIQFGILLLIATPIARVLFSIFAFFRQRDGIYVLVTSIVFGLLIFGLVGGGI